MKNKFKLGLHIDKINRIISRKIDATVIRCIDGKITLSQAYVIDFISDTNESRDIFQKDIEKEFDLKRSSVSLMLNNMEKNDLIKRVPVAKDARLKKIVLTEKSIELSKKISDAIDSGENQLAKDITPEEIEVFYKILGKIRNNLDDEF